MCAGAYEAVDCGSPFVGLAPVDAHFVLGLALVDGIAFADQVRNDLVDSLLWKTSCATNQSKHL